MSSDRYVLSHVRYRAKEAYVTYRKAYVLYVQPTRRTVLTVTRDRPRRDPALSPTPAARAGGPRTGADGTRVVS